MPEVLKSILKIGLRTEVLTEMMMLQCFTLLSRRQRRADGTTIRQFNRIAQRCLSLTRWVWPSRRGNICHAIFNQPTSVFFPFLTCPSIFLPLPPVHRGPPQRHQKCSNLPPAHTLSKGPFNLCLYLESLWSLLLCLSSANNLIDCIVMNLSCRGELHPSGIPDYCQCSDIIKPL